ncbi:sirohydrochlorin chelatase [Thiobacillus sp.]
MPLTRPTGHSLLPLFILPSSSAKTGIETSPINRAPSVPHCPRQPPRGATEIVAFPYFLAAGTHVAQDIPEAIAELSAEHPAVKVRLTPD